MASDYRKKQLMEDYGITEKEYFSIHCWIRTKLGTATKCAECGSANSKRCHWALIKGYKYEKNIDNFIPLCVSCHLKYDYTTERKAKLSDALRKRIRNPESYIKMAEKQRGKCISQITREKISKSLLGRPSILKKPVILFKNNMTISFPAITTASAHLGIGITSITNALNGRSRSCGGFKVSYLTDEKRLKIKPPNHDHT